MAKTRKKCAFYKGLIATSVICYTILLKAYIVNTFKLLNNTFIIQVSCNLLKNPLVSLSDKNK